jgi:uncharacterized LabA/DUF88 family protein
LPGRVCVFIDGSNLYHACRENLGGRTDLNLGAFSSWLVTPSRQHVRTYYYNCPVRPDAPPEAQKTQQRFYGMLYRTPYFEVRLGKLVPREAHCDGCNTTRQIWTEKGVDMRIGIDMLSGAIKNLYDTAILVSGDADFAEALRAAKETGRHVEVASFVPSRAYELLQVADVCRDLIAADLRPLLVRQ